MTALVATTDLTAYYDARVIADLASDSDIPVADEDFSTNTVITAAIEAASGKLESACLVGERYTEAKLLALTGNALAYMKRLVCTLAMAYLCARRQGKHREEYEAQLKEAQEDIDRLRNGEAIFGSDADSVAAGNPEVDGPDVVDYQQYNRIPERVKRFYPPRGQRLEIGRGG